jgi:hypothetical protein
MSANVFAAIVGTASFASLVAAGLIVIWRLCNGKRASAAQRIHVPTDTDSDSSQIFCAQEGMVRIENHEWKPFDRGGF